MSLLFLVHNPKYISDGNCLRLVNAALQQNLDTVIADIDSLCLHKHQIGAKGFAISSPINTGPRNDLSKLYFLADFKTVWILSLGRRDNFLDKIQLLRLAEKTTKLVNSVDALMFL